MLHNLIQIFTPRSAAAKYGEQLQTAMSYAAGESEEQRKLYDCADALDVSDIGDAREYVDQVLSEARRDYELILNQYEQLKAASPPPELVRVHHAAIELLRCTLVSMNHFDSAIEARIEGNKGAHTFHVEELQAWSELTYVAEIEYADAVQAVIDQDTAVQRELLGFLADQTLNLKLSC